MPTHFGSRRILRRAHHTIPSRFKQTVYDTEFGRRKLDKLRPIDVQRWREDLIKDDKRKKQTANRILRTFKAAMNYARGVGMVASDNAWANVKAFPAANGRREVFLTKGQVKDMLDAAPSDLTAIPDAALELPKAGVRDLDIAAGVPGAIH